MQSYAYNAPDTQHALYSANNYATTIRYSLYNAPWLPCPFQIAGAKNATQQIRNRLGAPTRNVSSSDGIAIYEEQEMEDHITQLTLSGDFNLVFTRFQQQTMTDNGP